MTFKKTLLIDLDGVLNTYTGDFDKNFIPPVKEGAKEFLENLSNDFTVKIFTTRNKIIAVKWLIENGLDKFTDDVTNVKELSWLYVDDRCVKFEGNFDDLRNKIDNFKPWYKLI